MIGTSPRIRCGSSSHIKILHFLVPFHATVPCTFTRHNFVSMNIVHWYTCCGTEFKRSPLFNSRVHYFFQLHSTIQVISFVSLLSLQLGMQDSCLYKRVSWLAIFLQNSHKKKWFNQPADIAYKSFLFWFTFTWLWTSYRERLNSFKNTWCAFSLWHL